MARWLIHAMPPAGDLADYKALRYNLLTIDPGREVVEARARQLRPPAMFEQVGRWYAYHGAAAPTATPTQLPATAGPTRDW